MSYLAFDLFKNDFMVMPEDMTLREFCIMKRKASGRTIGNISLAIGMGHPGLRSVEWPLKGRKMNNSTGLLLRALQELGFETEIKKL